jgi:putative tricarboxylic transport membrane protein
MDILSGLTVVLSGNNVFFLLVGAGFGLVVGALPGISPAAALAFVLPLTFGLSPVGAILAMVGAASGAVAGRSIAALHVAGLDATGEQDAARIAPIALAAAGGALVAAIVAVVLTPVVARLSLMFGPAEFAALMIAVFLVGIAMVPASPARSFGAIVLGLLLSMIGTDIETGAPRLTFGMTALADGVSFIAIVVGLFVVADAIRILTAPEGGWPQPRADGASALGPARATLLGLLTGILPGSGTSLTFPASDRGERPADGLDPANQDRGERIAAAAAASGARLNGSFLPMLSLGIPTNAAAAVLVSSLMIQGIVPGPQLMTRQPELFWAFCGAILLIPLALLAGAALGAGGILVGLSRTPSRAIAPVMLAGACLTVFIFNATAFDVYATIAFGVLGYFFTRTDCERGLLVIAFVMGPLLEENFRRAMLVARGEIAAIMSRPMVATVLAAALTLAVLAFISNRKAAAP